jgi:hypothetical protein
MWDKLRDVWDGMVEFMRLPDLFSAIAEHIKVILLTAAILVLSILALYLAINRSEPPLGDREEKVSTPQETPGSEPPVEITDAKGRDDQGREASFRILVFSRDFAWVYESDREVEYQGAPDDITPHLRSPGLQENFRNAKALIAVGAASQEGTETDEEKRARRRAERLQRWIKENVAGSQRLHTLSMGRFIGPTTKLASTAQTAPQRRIVIVAVMASDDDVVLEEALRSAVIEEEAFPFDLNEYSLFELSDWR